MARDRITAVEWPARVAATSVAHPIRVAGAEVALGDEFSFIFVAAALIHLEE